MSDHDRDPAAHLEWVAGVRREKMDDAAHWTAITREAVKSAVNAGMTEVEAAKLAGVTRMTIRAWLGKGH